MDIIVVKTVKLITQSKNEGSALHILHS